jgi:hypothetical protein
LKNKAGAIAILEKIDPFEIEALFREYKEFKEQMI